MLSKSESINASLTAMGINTPMDVLMHFPRRYDSFIYTKPKDIYVNKERIVLLGKVREHTSQMLKFAKRSLYRFFFETTDGRVFEVEAWNRQYLPKIIEGGELYTLTGSYNVSKHTVSLINLVKGEIAKENSLRPVYSLTGELTNSYFSNLVKRSLAKSINQIQDIIPDFLREKHHLISKQEAIREIHFPTSPANLHQATRVLKYEEALIFELQNMIIRLENKALLKGEKTPVDNIKLSKFINALPFSLTQSQQIAIQEAINDMNDSSVMYRLLQGDVGTGKTLVAAILAYANSTRRQQTAILAPTETLAKQHYESLTSLKGFDALRTILLTGSMTPSEKKAAYRQIEAGAADVIIGTHAIFSKGVAYHDLGLAIIDEQHKFGVNQRSRLLGKGENTDLLLMSATPIPRTLALSIYGDLDVSTLSEFPSGKRNVKTAVVRSKDARINKSIKWSLSKGGNVYIIAPNIDPISKNDYVSAEKIFEKYSQLFPDQVTLLHGRLSDEEKDAAIDEFKSGRKPILVATSLVEVGINVKKANLMIIYSATHFSLSSLHQLRGRVGRAGDEAFCILVSDEDDLEKLSVLVRNDDGFKIAEADLRLRGPGEIAGTKQSGLPDFALANIVNDFAIFEHARNDASFIIREKRFELQIVKIAKLRVENNTLS
ncbi:MAG: ATP-dependent DNA helicase RecG [Bacilli bacterium]|nr:ATP-dependent DNA helicase RecG [Bacilli bacterium]